MMTELIALAMTVAMPEPGTLPTLATYLAGIASLAYLLKRGARRDKR